MLNKVKLALGVVTTEYDSELTSLIEAAKLDLGIAGIFLQDTLDAIVERAIITYCKLNFLGLSDGEYDRLKKSYDEQKMQLRTNSAYKE